MVTQVSWVMLVMFHNAGNDHNTGKDQWWTNTALARVDTAETGCCKMRWTMHACTVVYKDVTLLYAIFAVEDVLILTKVYKCPHGLPHINYLFQTVACNWQERFGHMYLQLTICVEMVFSCCMMYRPSLPPLFGGLCSLIYLFSKLVFGIFLYSTIICWFLYFLHSQHTLYKIGIYFTVISFLSSLVAMLLQSSFR